MFKFYLRSTFGHVNKFIFKSPSLHKDRRWQQLIWTMGYNIYITRKQDWFDGDDLNEIKLAEWTDYIQSDSEMKLDNYAETENDLEEKIRYENEGIAIWTSYSKHGLDDNFAWFDFSN